MMMMMVRMQHAVNHLPPVVSSSTATALIRYSAAACSRDLNIDHSSSSSSRAAYYTTSRSPTSSSCAHHHVRMNLGDNPPPYSLQPTSAQRHDNMDSGAGAGAGAASQQSLKPIDPVTKRYDDMHESYGEGYATRSSEEGFGSIYSSPLIDKASHSRDDDDDVAAAGTETVLQEFDHTQGSPVAEKERSSRHGTGFTPS